MSWTAVPGRGVAFLVGLVAVGCMAPNGTASVAPLEPTADSSSPDALQPGWYAAPGRNPVLISPAPGGGYRRLDFANTDFGGLELGGEDGYRWVETADGGPALEDGDGLRWTPRADGPYEVMEVRFEGGRGADLAGLLLTPREPSGRGAVILHGSGASDRDNVWAYTFAHALAEVGVAVLFPDKRGSGASGGDWQGAGFDLLAHDAVAGAVELARRSSLPLDSIGWVGLSQGGWVAPLAARVAGGGAFVLSVSSAAVPVFDQIAFELENTLRSREFSKPAIQVSLGLQSVLRDHALGRATWGEYEAARNQTLAGPAAPFAEAMPGTPDDWHWGWWAQVGEYDVIESWARAGVPTLVVYGADDETDNVPVERSAEEVRSLSRRPVVGRLVDLAVFPGLGHSLVDQETGWIAEGVLQRLQAFALGRSLGTSGR